MWNDEAFTKLIAGSFHDGGDGGFISLRCVPALATHGVASAQQVFQERILEWIDISFPRESSRPRDQTCVLQRYRGRVLYQLSHHVSQIIMLYTLNLYSL